MAPDMINTAGEATLIGNEIVNSTSEGDKKCPNPHGAVGKPDHQQKVIDLGEKREVK